MKARTDDVGWSTGPALANDMAVDETAAEKEAAPSTSIEPSGKDQAHTSMHAYKRAVVACCVLVAWSEHACQFDAALRQGRWQQHDAARSARRQEAQIGCCRSHIVSIASQSSACRLALHQQMHAVCISVT